MRRPPHPARTAVVEAQHHGDPLHVDDVAHADPGRTVPADGDVGKARVVERAVIGQRRRLPTHPIVRRADAVQLWPIAVEDPDLAAAAPGAGRRFLGVRGGQRRHLHRRGRQCRHRRARPARPAPRPPRDGKALHADLPGRRRPQHAHDRTHLRTGTGRRRDSGVAIRDVRRRMPEQRPPEERVAGKGRAAFAADGDGCQRIRLGLDREKIVTEGAHGLTLLQPNLRPRRRRPRIRHHHPLKLPSIHLRQLLARRQITRRRARPP